MSFSTFFQPANSTFAGEWRVDTSSSYVNNAKRVEKVISSNVCIPTAGCFKRHLLAEIRTFWTKCNFFILTFKQQHSKQWTSHSLDTLHVSFDVYKLWWPALYSLFAVHSQLSVPMWVSNFLFESGLSSSFSTIRSSLHCLRHLRLSWTIMVPGACKIRVQSPPSSM